MAFTFRRGLFVGTIMVAALSTVVACSSSTSSGDDSVGSPTSSAQSGTPGSGSAASGSAESNSDGASTDASSNAAAAAPTRTLFAGFTSPPSTFDPAKAGAYDDYLADSLLYSTLLSRDTNSALVGNLASSYKAVSSSEYTLTIRDGATCADGTAIDATVVANSLKYLASFDGGSAAAVFGTGTPTITADDASATVTIHTAAAYTNLPVALTMPQAGIICPAGLADKKGLAAGTVTAASSGPYTLGTVKPGVSYEFDLRKDFSTWPDFAQPLTGRAASKIQFGINTDESTAINKALAGQQDAVLVSGNNIKRFDGSKFNSVKTVVAITYVLFNERKGHYFADNEAGRKAVAEAIDRTQYNQIFSAGVSPVYNTVAPPDYACALDEPSLIPSQDAAAAAKALKGAKINFIASTAFAQDGAEYITQMLRDAGATVKLDLADNSAWASRLHKPNDTWDVTIKGDIPTLGVVDDSLQRIIGPAIEDGGRSETASDNPAGEKALNEALATADPTTRCDLLKTAQRTVLQRMDVIPLAGIIRDMFTSPDVTIRAPGGQANFATLRITD